MIVHCLEAFATGPLPGSSNTLDPRPSKTLDLVNSFPYMRPHRSPPPSSCRGFSDSCQRANSKEGGGATPRKGNAPRAQTKKRGCFIQSVIVSLGFGCKFLWGGGVHNEVPLFTNSQSNTPNDGKHRLDFVHGAPSEKVSWRSHRQHKLNSETRYYDMPPHPTMHGVVVWSGHLLQRVLL